MSETGQSFDDDIWDLTSLKAKYYEGKARVQLYFGDIDDRGEQEPTQNKLVIKAYLALYESVPPNRQRMLRSIKALYQTLKGYCVQNNLDIVWQQLSNELLAQHQASIMQKELAYTTRYHYLCHAIQFAKFLALHNLCPEIDYKHGLTTPHERNRTKLVEIEKRADRLPDPQVLHTFADLRNRVEDPRDWMVLTILCIQIATGLRINEVLTLSANCQVHDGERYGLTYTNSKPLFRDILWIPPSRIEAVKTMMEEVVQVTDAARKRAKIQEAHPQRVPLPGWQSEAYISSKKLAELLGNLGSGLAQFWHRRKNRPKPYKRKGKNETVYKVQEVEESLAELLPPTNEVVVYGPNDKQMLSDSLFVTFSTTFNSSVKHKFELIVELVSARRLFVALKGQSNIFIKYDLRDDQGNLLDYNTHQARHFNVDTAYFGGASVEEIAIFQNRRNLQQTEQYIHPTEERLLEAFRQSIREGEMSGFVPEAYRNLPAYQQEDYLVAMTQHVHPSPIGWCLHDQNTEPCPYSLACFHNCPNYIPPTEHEPVELQRLWDLAVRLVDNLAREVNRSQERNRPIVDKWMQDAFAKVEGILNALPPTMANQLRERQKATMSHFITVDELMSTLSA